MGFISILRQWATRDRGGETFSEATATGTGGATSTAQYFQPTGEDSQPLPGDYLVTLGGRGAGAAVVGCKDSKVTHQAGPGEVRRYARKANGDQAVELWLKANGSAIIRNSKGAIVLNADGSVNINGATISASGQITDAKGIQLDTHRHPGVQAGPSTTLGAIP